MSGHHYVLLVGKCNKRIYPTPSLAKKLARRMNSGRNSTIGHYHCKECRGWHLGSSAGGKLRGKKPRGSD